jgi:hypothetical protein
MRRLIKFENGFGLLKRKHESEFSFQYPKTIIKLDNFGVILGKKSIFFVKIRFFDEASVDFQLLVLDSVDPKKLTKITSSRKLLEHLQLGQIF